MRELIAMIMLRLSNVIKDAGDFFFGAPLATNEEDEELFERAEKALLNHHKQQLAKIAATTTEEGSPMAHLADPLRKQFDQAIENEATGLRR